MPSLSVIRYSPERPEVPKRCIYGRGARLSARFTDKDRSPSWSKPDGLTPWDRLRIFSLLISLDTDRDITSATDVITVADVMSLLQLIHLTNVIIVKRQLTFDKS